MKKTSIVFIFALIISFIILFNFNNSYASTDLDEISSYIITVDPRMYDGTLDITYEITWKVLDSTSEGPLTWVQIGTPNEYFDSAEALSDNIASISKYNGSYVKIVFDRAYTAGKQIKFKYKIHQKYMYTLKSTQCVYKFTPAWFNEIKIKHMEIRWNSDNIKTSDDNGDTKKGYVVWEKDNLDHGEKLTATVKYSKNAFSSLNKDESKSYLTEKKIQSLLVIVFFVMIFIMIFGGFGGGGYYRHRGFYGGGYYGGYHHSRYHSGCVHSSCAHSSCACACAGSGRAGCSRKDFYGTNLTSKKIKKVMENKS